MTADFAMLLSWRCAGCPTARIVFFAAPAAALYLGGPAGAGFQR